MYTNSAFSVAEAYTVHGYLRSGESTFCNSLVSILVGKIQAPSHVLGIYAAFFFFSLLGITFPPPEKIITIVI